MRQNIEEARLTGGVWKNGRFGGARNILSANVILTQFANPAQFYDPNGGAWTITLPATRLGLFFAVFNVGGSGSLSVVDEFSTPVLTLAASEGVLLFSSSTEWGTVQGQTGDLSQSAAEVEVTSGPTYDVAEEFFGTILVNQTVSGALAINLPPAADAAGCVLVKDLKGDCSTYNITVTPDGVELIDGLSAYVLSFDYSSVMLKPRPDGIGWYVR